MESHKPSESDRRAVAREFTRRTAFFSPLSGEGPLVEGWVVDISPNGLQLQTAHSAVQGRRLEIELHPRDGQPVSDVLLVQGQVVWVNEVARDNYLLGIEFLLKRPGQTAITMTGHRDLAEREAYTRTLETRLAQLDEGEANSLDEESGIERRATRMPAQNQSKKSRWPLLMAMLLSFLLGMFVLMALWPNSDHARGRAGLSTFARFGNVPAILPETAPNETPDGNAAPRTNLTRSRTLPPEGRLAVAQTALTAGDLSAAAALFSDVAKDPASRPIEGYSARLGLGFVAFAQGDKTEAIAGLSEILEAFPEAPEAWQDKVRDVRRAMAQFPDLESMPFPWSSAIELGTLEDIGAPGPIPGTESRERSIEVDLDAYTLAVLEGGVPLAVFAVGLGEDNSTPEGAFFVANKIKNPDWYNRGDVIKAGDPRNPLGAYWVGLADETGPTPIGIHPTELSGSIRNEASRGCIRLFPEDAARVFALCQVGTPVLIFRGGGDLRPE